MLYLKKMVWISFFISLSSIAMYITSGANLLYSLPYKLITAYATIEHPVPRFGREGGFY